MKKSIIILVGCLALVVALGATVGVLAMDNSLWFQKEEPNDAYVFPKYQGEEALDYNQILEFNQVPEKVLANMSTEGLVETCLNYPLFSIGMITSNESMYAGFKKTCTEFYGLQELFKREDAGGEIFELYKNMTFSEVKQSDKYPIFRLKYLEYILSQEEILSRLTIEEREELKNVCINGMIEKYHKSDTLYADSTLLVIARIMNIDNAEFIIYKESHPKVNAFVEMGVLESFTNEEF